MKATKISAGVWTNKRAGWWMMQVCWRGGSSLIFITLWYTQQSADEPLFSTITPTVTGFVCLTEIRRKEEGGCDGAHQKRDMNGSHLVQLLPRVAPGPVVRFVLAQPHGHQLVPTVIEDRPVRQMQTENIRSFHEPIITLLPLFLNTGEA